MLMSTFLLKKTKRYLVLLIKIIKLMSLLVMIVAVRSLKTQGPIEM